MVDLRQPVVVVLGHVDSGKTSLLDKVRGTAVQAREVGGITQHIGASFFPVETVKEITGLLYAKLAKAETPIPGLLVIDTPGHEVFANLRMRGGSAADIAIVVVDVNKGFEAQTIESVDILKKRKVPFVVALNKVDMVAGWRSSSKFISEEVKKQGMNIQTALDEKIYTVVGALSRLPVGGVLARQGLYKGSRHSACQRKDGPRYSRIAGGVGWPDAAVHGKEARAPCRGAGKGHRARVQ
jgi:translation initiation factor 5B